MSKVPQWDAHLAWSGGVESTSILAWAINTGHKVRVFHSYAHWDNQKGDDYLFTDKQKWKKGQYDACKKMEEIWLEPLGINVHYCHSGVESKAYGLHPWSDYDNSDMHQFFLWMYYGLIFTQVDRCKTIWYGDNYGLDSYADGLGDENWTLDEFMVLNEDGSYADDEMNQRNPTYQLYKDACKLIAEGSYGPDRLVMECPIPHRTKTEMWEMIPDFVKPHVFTTDRSWVVNSENYRKWRKENADKIKT